VIVRSATRDDVPLILTFIRELATYEKLDHEVVATEAGLAETLFGEVPRAEVLIAEQDGVPAGFALFFHNYSTFLGKPGIYLEDLFVRPEARHHGIGRALLARLAEIAVRRGCSRLEWAVLDWNGDAIGFYRKLGATPMDDWTTYRLAGEALAALSALSPPTNARNRSPRGNPPPRR
jgi:GNAT superfamily N-acetyltransferase